MAPASVSRTQHANLHQQRLEIRPSRKTILTPNAQRHNEEDGVEVLRRIVVAWEVITSCISAAVMSMQGSMSMILRV